MGQVLQNKASLTDKEQRLLLWNTKNIEYAFGADISDISMKYWDIGKSFDTPLFALPPILCLNHTNLDDRR
jgi:hypothetical protein